ncbi:Lrp/AsnC family transcriptional regulator [Metallosphaera tengchongensis]|uniref:Lrp/AsnC family transcriptional regulator n=1 Tax=Metallosphaera tengchongensis TaxID=1532350 RepID=A0A6N0NWG0_9CREN|nr:Lrp/AsnC family transcriptional regulator [Metallosphaera tengchongensis]QKR00213.1 Lrp/AsnC family transcriptional regulator [Metallosphaera tengchongensis]
MQDGKVDEIDLKILGRLRYNAKYTLTALSKEIGLPVSTIRYRIKKLEENEIIKGYVPLIDRLNLGYKVSIVMEIDAIPKYMDKVVNEISQFPSIVRVYGMDSGPRLHVHAVFKEEEEAYSFISNRLYNIKGINSVDTSKIIRRYKIDPSILL